MDKRWYQTPETCEDPSRLNHIEKRIYDEILKLRELEQLDPTVNVDQRRAFLEQLSWESSQLTPEKQAMVERLLLKYHHIFARHRLDIGINNEFKTKLTPKHDELVAVQNLPTPKKLKDKMLVELGVQKVYGILKIYFLSSTRIPFFHTLNQTESCISTWHGTD